MSAGKLMATIFWDKKGVLMMEFVQQGTTIKSEVYCEKKKLRRAIQNQRYGMLTYGVVPLRYKARPPNGSCVTTILAALIPLRATTTCIPT
jgi:hypothetical protein